MRKSAVVLLIGLILGFVVAVPLIALGDGPLSQLALIRAGGGVPHKDSEDPTGHGVLKSTDVGVNPWQVAIAFGYGIEYGDLSMGSLEIADDGTVSGGGCAIVVLMPGFYRDFMILDGNRTTFDLPGINTNFWIKKLVSERVSEQTAHYACSYELADIQVWNEDGTASPFLSAVTASAATVSPESATPAATVEAATAAPAATPVATAAPAALERRPSGTNQKIGFAAGESVYGWAIELDSGVNCNTGECYLLVAPTGGKVTSGVVNPWPDEVSSSARANPWDGTSNRQPAG